MNTLEVVAAIIRRADGKILLAERPPGKHLAGLLEFPGGKIEPGETPERAIHRELREELDLEVRIDRFLGVFPHDYSIFKINLHIFFVEPKNSPRETRDVHRFFWLDPHRLDVKALAPADHEPWRTYTNLTRGERS